MLVERQIAAVALAARAKGVEMPTFEAERHRLDRLLDDVERRTYSDEQAALIAALGLGGGR